VHRFDHPDDMVRLELEAALERKRRVIPVLIEGASMPRADELPESLREICYRSAVAVRPDPDFKTDMPRLIVTLRLPREDRPLHPHPPTRLTRLSSTVRAAS
jgi:hypothetical protein